MCDPPCLIHAADSCKYHNSVPVSQDEDADTEVVRTWGTPRTGDDLLHHHDLLWCVLICMHTFDRSVSNGPGLICCHGTRCRRIGGFEPERGSAVAGHRGYFLRDAGLLLNQVRRADSTEQMIHRFPYTCI